jgi:UDPglucose 6-dehydrogenase
MRSSVIGLGKLGCPLAVVLASKGHNVIGVDLDPTVVSDVSAGVAPFAEPHLQELLSSAHAAGRLTATSDIAQAVRSTEVTFVVVPTPSDASGGFALDAVTAAMEGIGAALRGRDGFHLVVLTSTVVPGSTRERIAPVLERASGGSCGVDFGLCYSPEFIALGSVVADLLNPDFVLIGESDDRSGKLLASIYDGLCENQPPIVRMGFANAELAKLAVNTFVTTKISYANMLAELCERLPDGDVDVVTRAIALDSRIGGRYLRGATAYGGPCFPRDNTALASFARSVGVEASLAVATDVVNRRQLDRLVDAVQRAASPESVVGVLGLAYKPHTYVVDESVGVALANELAAVDFRVIVHDPLALAQVGRELSPSVDLVDSVEEIVQRVDVAVIATPWPEYRALERAEPSRGRLIVIDCWRLLDKTSVSAEIELVLPGVGVKVPALDVQ